MHFFRLGDRVQPEEARTVSVWTFSEALLDETGE
jgi:hypothetical protein